MTETMSDVPKIDESSSLSAICLHRLVAIDIAPLSPEDSNREEEIRNLSRTNAKLLLSSIRALPTEMTEEGRVAVLPVRPGISNPRAKRLPVDAPATRWEKFAKEQNIHKKKRSRMVFDNMSNDWKPRWGPQSAKNARRKAEEAIIEMKPNEKVEDVLATRRAGAKIMKKKQELRTIRNVVEAKGGRMSNGTSAGIAALNPDVNDRKKGKHALSEMMGRAQVSTASRGRFDPVLRTRKTLAKKSTKKHAPKKGKKFAG